MAEPRDQRSTRAAAGASHVRWWILGLMVGVSFVAYVLRSNLQIVGPTMVAELGISEVQLGVVVSAFLLGYALFQFPGGVLGDRLGPRLTLTLILVGTGVLTLLTGLAPGASTVSTGTLLALLVVVRFALGVVQAPVFPVMGGAMVSNWFPVSAWGLPTGLQNVGLTLGGAAAGPLVVGLMSVVGWRASFLVTAPLAFVLAGVWWWHTRDYPSEHPGVNTAEQTLIDADRPPPEAARAQRRVWRAVLGNRDLLLLTLSYFCMNYVFYLFFNWFFYYLVEVRGFAAERAAALSAAQWVVGAAGALVGGWACDVRMRRAGIRRGARQVPVAGLVVGAALLGAGAWCDRPLLAVILLAACFGCMQLTDAAYWAATIAVGDRHAGSATGILNTAGNLVGFVGALAVPVLAQRLGWPWAIGSGAAAALVGAVLWLGVRADHRLEIPVSSG